MTQSIHVNLKRTFITSRYLVKMTWIIQNKIEQEENDETLHQVPSDIYADT